MLEHAHSRGSVLVDDDREISLSDARVMKGEEGWTVDAESGGYVHAYTVSDE